MGRLLCVGIAMLVFHLFVWEDHSLAAILAQILLGGALSRSGLGAVLCGLFLFGGGEGLPAAALVAAVISPDLSGEGGRRRVEPFLGVLLLLWMFAPGALIVALPALLWWLRSQQFSRMSLLWGALTLIAGLAWTLRPDFARTLHDLFATASFYPPALSGLFFGIPVLVIAVIALLRRPQACLPWVLQAMASILIALYLGKGFPAPETVPLLLLLFAALSLLSGRWSLLLFGMLYLWSLAPRPAAVAPQYTGAADQPGEQSLFMWESGQEVGPLLPEVSSAEVWREAAGWAMWFVRHDEVGRPGIWESHSVDGRSWEPPRRLGIAGYDPARIVDPSGKEWLIVVQSVEERVDPARAATRIRRYQRKGEGWEEEAVLIEGFGLVDPAPQIRPDGSWELYYTAPPTSIRRALSPDGRTFTPDLSYVVLDTTVPGWVDGQLYAQRHVRARSQLFRLEGSWKPLGICGTGISGVGGRLYYSRGKGPC